MEETNDWRQGLLALVLLVGWPIELFALYCLWIVGIIVVSGGFESAEERTYNKHYEVGLVELDARIAMDAYLGQHHNLYPAADRFAAELSPYYRTLHPRTTYGVTWRPADVVTIPWSERHWKLGPGHFYDGKRFDRATYGVVVYTCSPDRKEARMFAVGEMNGHAVREQGPP